MTGTGFYTYLVGWDDTLDIKAGVTTHPRRWESFERRGARLYQLHAAGPTDRNLCTLEANLHAWLGESGYVGPAFHYKEQGARQLGGRGCGYTETFHAWCVAFYEHALASCASIMREHPTGQCGEDMRALMHGRTDERTYVEPHSPNATISLFSDAHAHIREMVVDKWGDR